jgi:Flp pilus assembly protein TadB
MAIPWQLALKVIPWGDVMEHAPKVLKAARKLMDRQKAEPAPSSMTEVDLTSEAVPSLGELKNRWIAAQGQLERQARTQAEMAQTLAELAEQNARLVSAVEWLRWRTRGLLWAVLVLALLTAWLVWR